MDNDAQHGLPPEDKSREASRERIYTPAEHQRHYAPLNEHLHPDDARHFGWRAENGTVQSYQHGATHRHIHIDGVSGQFYNQQKNPISQHAALDRAMGAGNHHAPVPARVQEAAEQQQRRAIDNSLGFGL